MHTQQKHSGTAYIRTAQRWAKRCDLLISSCCFILY